MWVGRTRLALPHLSVIRPFCRNLATAKKDEYDVVVVGGGMVGSAFAAALGSTSLTKHLRVGLIEAHESSSLNKLPDKPELRVSAVSVGSASLFKAVGAWEPMVNTGRVKSFSKMKVWDSTGEGRINFTAQEFGKENIGYFIENNVLTGALLQVMEGLPSVEVICPAKVVSIQKRTPESLVEVDIGTRTLQTKLLVGADGARSVVRQSFEDAFPPYGYSYNQKGVVTTLNLSQPTTTAYQRFLTTGPVACLPLWDSYGSLVWSVPTAMADRLTKVDEAQFLKELVHAFRDQAPADFDMPDIVGISKRASFPLAVSHLSTYVTDRVALIGDAAHTVHPLAGQGVNIGFGDAASLCRTLSEEVECGYGIGELTGLRRYENDRLKVNAGVLAGVDAIKRIFATTAAPNVFLRNCGLAVTNNLSFVKTTLMQQAIEGSINVQGIGH